MNNIALEEAILKVEAYENATRAASSLALLSKTDSERMFYESELNTYKTMLKLSRAELEGLRLKNVEKQ